MFKECFKCHTMKPLSEFYKHSEMADGYVNKCKECNKKDNSANYYSHVESYREYDRRRETTASRKEKKKAYYKNYNTRHPERRKAHIAVNNALRDKRVIKTPCEVCGEVKVQAHHKDYLKPLEIQWLCKDHHKKAHKQLFPGA